MLPVEAQAGVYPSARTAGGVYSLPSVKRSEGINVSTVRYLDIELRKRGKWDI